MNILPENNIPTEFQQEKWFPITWDHINGIEPGYYISTWGRFYNEDKQKFYPTENSKKEWYISMYFQLINGSYFQVPIHRFMMFYFNPINNWRNLEVNHKDGIKYHNWIWNLEWVTHQENMSHAIKTGLSKYGEEAGASVLSNDNVRLICKYIANGKSPKEIGEELAYINPEMDISAVADSIKNGYAWKQIASEFDFSNMYTRQYLFTEEQIHKICSSFEKFGRDLSYRVIMAILKIDSSNMTKKELANYNVCIYNLRNKKVFKDICNLYKY